MVCVVASALCVCVWTGGRLCLDSWQLSVTDDVSILPLQRDESEEGIYVCPCDLLEVGGLDIYKHTYTPNTHTFYFIYF